MVSPSSQPHGPGEGVKGASNGTFTGAEVDRNHGDPVSANYVNVLHMQFECSQLCVVCM